MTFEVAELEPYLTWRHFSSNSLLLSVSRAWQEEPYEKSHQMVLEDLLQDHGLVELSEWVHDFPNNLVGVRWINWKIWGPALVRIVPVEYVQLHEADYSLDANGGNSWITVNLPTDLLQTYHNYADNPRPIRKTLKQAHCYLSLVLIYYAWKSEI